MISTSNVQSLKGGTVLKTKKIFILKYIPHFSSAKQRLKNNSGSTVKNIKNGSGNKKRDIISMATERCERHDEVNRNYKINQSKKNMFLTWAQTESVVRNKETPAFPFECRQFDGLTRRGPDKFMAGLKTWKETGLTVVQVSAETRWRETETEL